MTDEGCTNRGGRGMAGMTREEEDEEEAEEIDGLWKCCETFSEVV